MDEFMSYGEILRRERQKQRIDLASMSQRLHIRPDILSSIEQSDFDRMPARGYSKNMIRAYARALGLDEQKILDSYLEEVHVHELGGIRIPNTSSRDYSDRRRPSRSSSSQNLNRSTDRYRSSRSRQTHSDSTDVLADQTPRSRRSRFLDDAYTDDEATQRNQESPRRSRESKRRDRAEGSASADLGRSSSSARSSRSRGSQPTGSKSRNLQDRSSESRDRSRSSKQGGRIGPHINIAGLFGSGSGTRGTKINKSFSTIGSTPPYAQSGRDRLSRIPSSLSEINLPLVLGIVCAVILIAILVAVITGGAQQNASEVPSIPISGLTDTSDTQDDGDNAEPDAAVQPTFVDVKYSIPGGEKSWIEIYEDGSSEPESAGVVSGPINETFEVTGSLRILAANPDSVTVTADGEKLSWTKDSASGYYSITVDYKQFYSSSSSSSSASSSATSSSSSSSRASSSSSSSRSTTSR